MPLLLLLTASRALTAPLRFHVEAAPGLLPRSVDGRMIVVLAPAGTAGEPRRRLGEVEAVEMPRMGVDANRFIAGKSRVVLDARKAVTFPDNGFARLRPGGYTVQAVLLWNPDLRLTNAPGNLYSRPIALQLTAADLAPSAPTKTFSLRLTEREPAERLPDSTPTVRWVKFRSERLSRFWKRPIFLRAGVVLPPRFGREPRRRYPLRVHVGGFGSRYTEARGIAPHPDLVQVALDGAGPLGDPYQVNSANNGPYGDAVVHELIPYLERTYRCGGNPWARFTDGGSTGGWVSFALQVLYPDFFGGCWSGFPDPLDFRAYETIDLYADPNAYQDKAGRERPSARDPQTNRVLYSIRQECQMENVLGRGDSYAHGSAGQWGAWNAVFGARSKMGQPIPLWDARTGRIDRSQLTHWSRYDLRRHLQANWTKKGQALKNKIHLWVGTRDDYYLEKGVRLMDDFLKQTRNPSASARVTYGPGKGHGWDPLTERQMQEEMTAVWRAHRKPTQAEGRR